LLVSAAVAYLPVEGPSTASETDITPRQNDEPQCQPRADYAPYCEPPGVLSFYRPSDCKARTVWKPSSRRSR